MDLLDVLDVPSGFNKEKDTYFPNPSDVNYWQARKNRTFFIDYDIGGSDMDFETTLLLELCKTIIIMNQEEKDIEKPDPIYVWIYSYGGSLEQANFACDLFISSRIPIITISMGVTMSAGFLIFLAGQRRYAFKHAQLLAHQGNAGFSGTAEQLEQAQANYKKQISAMKDYILERTDIDEKTFNRNKTKDWYFSLEELEKYKICEIVDKFEDIV